MVDLRFFGAFLDDELLDIVVSELVELQEVLVLPNMLLHFFQFLVVLLISDGILDFVLT